MPNAKELAIQLRKFADSLDTNPDAVIVSPRLSFYHFAHQENIKEMFFNLAKLLPRPLAKSNSYDQSEITLSYETPALQIYASVPKSATCELVEPAKPAVYRCEPILSVEDESTLEVL